MQPEIIISILNWNGEKILQNCLESLYDNTAYENYEVVVLDNGSKDNSVNMMENKFPDTELIINDENQGFSKGHNQVIDHISDRDWDYVLLLNNDVEIIDENWLQELISVAGSSEAVGLTGCKVVEANGEIHYDGRHFPFDKFLFPTLSKKYDYNRYQQEESPTEFEYVDEVVGAVFMIDRDVINTIGGLDEAYSPVYSEESDFCVRTWDAGYRIAYTDQTRVSHIRHESSTNMDGLYLAYVKQRNIFRFVLTNYPMSWILVAFPMMILRASFFCFNITRDGVTVRDDFRQNPVKAVKYAILSYLAVILSLGDIVSKRKNRDNVKQLLK